jgi:hypothetical protein
VRPPMGGAAVSGEAQPAVVVTADPVAADEIGHNRGLLNLVVVQEGLQRLGELGVTGRITGERVENLPVPASPCSVRVRLKVASISRSRCLSQ